MSVNYPYYGTAVAPSNGGQVSSTITNFPVLQNVHVDPTQLPLSTTGVVTQLPSVLINDTTAVKVNVVQTVGGGGGTVQINDQNNNPIIATNPFPIVLSGFNRWLDNPIPVEITKRTQDKGFEETQQIQATIRYTNFPITLPTNTANKKRRIRLLNGSCILSQPWNGSTSNSQPAWDPNDKTNLIWKYQGSDVSQPVYMKPRVPYDSYININDLGTYSFVGVEVSCSQSTGVYDTYTNSQLGIIGTLFVQPTTTNCYIFDKLQGDQKSFVIPETTTQLTINCDYLILKASYDVTIQNFLYRYPVNNTVSAIDFTGGTNNIECPNWRRAVYLTLMIEYIN